MMVKRRWAWARMARRSERAELASLGQSSVSIAVGGRTRGHSQRSRTLHGVPPSTTAQWLPADQESFRQQSRRDGIRSARRHTAPKHRERTATRSDAIPLLRQPSPVVLGGVGGAEKRPAIQYGPTAARDRIRTVSPAKQLLALRTKLKRRDRLAQRANVLVCCWRSQALPQTRSPRREANPQAAIGPRPLSCAGTQAGPYPGWRAATSRSIIDPLSTLLALASIDDQKPRRQLPDGPTFAVAGSPLRERESVLAGGATSSAVRLRSASSEGVQDALATGSGADHVTLRLRLVKPVR